MAEIILNYKEEDLIGKIASVELQYLIFEKSKMKKRSKQVQI